MPTSTVENYLKQLYLEAHNTPAALVSLGKLATALNVTPGTVTTMVKALADSGLVVYEPRTGAKLTEGGEQLALHVLRRHRLVELLLVRVLGLDWSEVHTEAEELEHAISDKVLASIDKLLGHPKFDPHGDPIPTATGRIIPRKVLPLSECRTDKRVRIARIDDQEEAFLKFAAEKGLTPGTQIKVHSRNDAADSVTIELPTGAALTLGTHAADKILVE